MSHIGQNIGKVYFITIKKFDIRDNIAYVGYAALGSSVYKPVWTIKKVTLDDGVPGKIEWTAYRSAVWENRESASYF